MPVNGAGQRNQGVMMKTVLLVDDDTMIIMLLSRVLSASGYKVASAANGALGVSAAQLETPDMVVMDMNMPVMTGFDAIRALRALPAFKTLPILALTGNTSAGDYEEAYDAGADGFMTKPFDPMEVLARIKEMCPP